VQCQFDLYVNRVVWKGRGEFRVGNGDDDMNSCCTVATAPSCYLYMVSGQPAHALFGG
jgi:hypothetical protein